jgi:capsular exopolysaccharide synthesis family protein
VEQTKVWPALRAAWWIPLLGLVLGSVAALTVSLVQKPLYSSSTQLFVSTADADSTSTLFQGSEFAQQRVRSYADLITGQDMARRVIDRLALDESPLQLSERVSATPVTDAVLIDVTVTDPSPQAAQRIVEAIGTEFPTYATELEATTPIGGSPVKVTVTERAELPQFPVSPKIPRNIALGALVGLLVGIGLVVARVRLDRSVKDAEEASALLHAPVIGMIVRSEALEKQHIIGWASDSLVAEGYRQLRTNLQFLDAEEPPRVIMVSSAMPSEGKTTLVINLASALSELGQRVAIVEADLREPKVSSYLDMVDGVGLANVLAGTATLDDASQNFREGMTVIPAGPIPPNPGELLASTIMAATLEKLRGQNDFVLIAAPPLLPVAEASGLAVHTDGVLLSARYGSTRKDQLRQAAATLERVGVKTLGLVLNIVPLRTELASSFGYESPYGYGAPSAADPRHASWSRSRRMGPRRSSTSPVQVRARRRAQHVARSGPLIAGDHGGPAP